MNSLLQKFQWIPRAPPTVAARITFPAEIGCKERRVQVLGDWVQAEHGTPGLAANAGSAHLPPSQPPSRLGSGPASASRGLENGLRTRSKGDSKQVPALISPNTREVASRVVGRKAARTPAHPPKSPSGSPPAIELQTVLVFDRGISTFGTD